MKRVLIVKTSSLGDIVHTLPALTDAMKAQDIVFDWVLEEGFAELPTLHPAVDRVIPVSLRRWRKRTLKAIFSGELSQFWHAIRQEPYDAIIDAQNLLKSAILTACARGPKWGPDKKSAREPLSTWFYNHSVSIPHRKEKQATDRIRELFAKVLNYPVPDLSKLDYGIHLRPQENTQAYVVFLHGTTWETKHWPESYWIELAKKMTANGLAVRLPWGSDNERLRAERIAAASGAEVLPKSSLKELAGILMNAKAVVAVDTGLAHLAAALNVPCVAIYGATDPALTGVQGNAVSILSAPFECAPCLKRYCTYKGPGEVVPACYGSISPDTVYRAVQKWLCV